MDQPPTHPLPRRVAWFAGFAVAAYLAYVTSQASGRIEASRRTVVYLERVASSDLSVGMTIAEATSALRSRQVEVVAIDSGSARATLFYSAGEIGDPILFVSFRRDRDALRLVEWRAKR